MIDDHLVLAIFIVILPAPGLISARHVKGAAVLLEGPRAVDFLAVDLAIVHDEVLPEVLLLKVCEAVALDPPLQDELTDVVVALASHDLTRSRLEGHPGHRVLLPVRLVVTLPHRVRLELVRLRDVIALGRDEGWLGHLVARNWHVGHGCLHHGLSHRLHHWLGHWLAHWLHHRLPHWLHHWLAHRLHHWLLLHHHWLLLHHHRLLLHLILRLLLLRLGIVGRRRGLFC
jgi:hypothetical protein